ncbi:recombinase family protein [Paractinoplanes abujensis]|uniref:recombinase family protein n=1 Tax=Paractinoplanes abujensis TaxID=882441 RepID=UPI00160CFE54|nr:recombinase family protein [Actinoplanes abujensis]
MDRKLDKLVSNPAEAATVRTIFDLYAIDRLGTKTIAGRLNDQGLRTRLGKPWSQHTVEMTITNRIYLGEKNFRDIVVPDAHEPIIALDQFDRAQNILAKRSTQIGQRAANPSAYTLTGLIRCPQCGRGYIGTAAKGRYKRIGTTPAGTATKPAATSTASTPTSWKPRSATPCSTSSPPATS